MVVVDAPFQLVLEKLQHAADMVLVDMRDIDEVELPALPGQLGKFAAHDPDGDGFISAEEIAAHHAEKAEAATTSGDASPAEDKAAMEGKCGEGKCGGMI